MQETHAKAASGPAKPLKAAAKAKSPAPALKAPKAEEQAPSTRSLINRTLSGMPYGSAMQLSYIKENDSDEKALDRMALNLEVISERLKKIADAEKAMQAELQEFQIITDGIQLLAKRIGML